MQNRHRGQIEAPRDCATYCEERDPIIDQDLWCISFPLITINYIYAFQF